MRWPTVIIVLCLSAWLVYALFDTPFGAQVIAPTERQADASTDPEPGGGPSTGNASEDEVASDPTGDPTGDRSTLIDGNRFRARVIDADGEPMTRFWVGIVKGGQGAARYSAPPFNAFGSYHEPRTVRLRVARLAAAAHFVS